MFALVLLALLLIGDADGQCTNTQQLLTCTTTYSNCISSAGTNTASVCSCVQTYWNCFTALGCCSLVPNCADIQNQLSTCNSATTGGSTTGGSTTAPALQTGYCQVYNDPWVRDFTSRTSRHCSVPSGTVLFSDGVTTVTGSEGRWWSSTLYTALKNLTISRSGYTSTYAAGTGQTLQTASGSFVATSNTFSDASNGLTITILERGSGSTAWLNVYLRGKRTGSTGLCVSNASCRSVSARNAAAASLVPRADATCDAITDPDTRATCNSDSTTVGNSTFSAAAAEVAQNWRSNGSSTFWISPFVLGALLLFFTL
jgi:hypothetical protein